MTFVTKPDIFIVGGPKCGTTSLSEWLGNFPTVELSNPKETHFLSPDVGRLPNIQNELDYSRCWSNTKTLKCESSVFYAFSEVAMDEIKKRNPDAKIIFMIRHPVKMAFSLYLQEKWSMHETSQSFEEAWSKQQERRNRCKGINSPWPSVLQYKQVCSLGSQLQKIQKLFRKENICVISLEELIADPKSVMGKVTKFLQLNEVTFEIPKLQEKKQFKSFAIRKLESVFFKLKNYKYFPTPGTGIMKNLFTKNRQKPTETLSPAMASLVKKDLLFEIELLNVLAGTDYK